jgi:hypothetical protein
VSGGSASTGAGAGATEALGPACAAVILRQGRQAGGASHPPGAPRCQLPQQCSATSVAGPPLPHAPAHPLQLERPERPTNACTSSSAEDNVQPSGSGICSGEGAPWAWHEVELSLVSVPARKGGSGGSAGGGGGGGGGGDGVKRMLLVSQARGRVAVGSVWGEVGVGGPRACAGQSGTLPLP